MTLPTWAAPTAAAPVDATVALPGSKSLTNRYLVIAALAAEPSRLRSPLRSRDTLLMVRALRALGVGIEDVPGTGSFGDDWVVTPAPLRGGVSVDCGLAGTVMRFLPAVAALADGPVAFDGDPHARRRPMLPVVKALQDLGVQVDDDGRGALPFVVRGTGEVRGGTVRIDASASSQFVSALLLAGARFTEGVTIESVGPPIPSEPHVVMTVEALRDVGVVVDGRGARDVAGRAGPHRGPGRPGRAGPVQRRALPGGGGRDRRPGDRPRVAAVHDPGRRRAARPARQHGRRRLPRPARPDRARHRRPLRHRGRPAPGGRADPGGRRPVRAGRLPVPPARHRPHPRPRDRPARGAGQGDQRPRGKVTETDDGLLITPAPLHGGVFGTYDDHRIATAAAVLGLMVPGVLVENVETTAKTLPGFAGPVGADAGQGGVSSPS